MSATLSDHEQMDNRAADNLVKVEGLAVDFGTKGWRSSPVRIVDSVSFGIGRGETLGLVGESGSGKSTIARAMLGLVPASAGSVHIDNVDLLKLSRKALRKHRQHAQMVFQDPFSSINPSMIVRDIIGEPIDVHERIGRKARNQRVYELLDAVRLPRRVQDRYVHEFSGGQRQRIAIARALATNPRLVICDEAVSALDVSTQNQIIELLDELSKQFQLSYLFISHGLDVVRYISERVAVLYLGKLVEIGPSSRIYGHPAHPYTRALLDASPVPNPRIQRAKTGSGVRGEPADPAKRPTGCPFVDRCPIATTKCRTEAPELRPVQGGGEVACHYPLEPTR